MSLRSVQKAGVGTNGGIGARLAAVLSVESTEGKRGRTTGFEYGKEQVGTVMSELATDKLANGRFGGLAQIMAPSLQYYVEMEDVDEKFYFNNLVQNRVLQDHSIATWNGSEYRFIDNLDNHKPTWVVDDGYNGDYPRYVDLVFATGTVVAFTPIPVNIFKIKSSTEPWSSASGYTPPEASYTLPGDNAATMIKAKGRKRASSSTARSM